MPLRPSFLLASLVCLLLSAACGDDSPSPSNAGAAGVGGQAGSAGQAGAAGQAGTAGQPSEPTPPAPPVLTPCPERWTEKMLPGGITACEPGPLPDWVCPEGWKPKAMLEGTPRQFNICEPPALPESCPEGTMPVLGESACQPIGDPCPAGDFPDNLPTNKPILYVKAGSSGGGSKEAPLGTISEAVKAASKGTIIAIAKGLYPEAVTVGAGKDVTLWGACAAETKIQGPEGKFPQATISALGNIGNKAKLAVKNLTISGERPGVNLYRAEGKLEGVEVKETEDTAIHVEAAMVALSSVVVRDTQSDPGTKKNGRGLFCKEGAKVKVERSFFHHNRQVGVFAAGEGTSVSLTDIVVQDTQSQESDKNFGRGLNCQDGAEVKVERSLFDHNRDFGVFALGAGTSLTLTDSVVQDTQSQESDKTFGRGLACEYGAQVKVERSFFLHNRELGVAAGDAGTSLTLSDTVIQDTQSQESDLTGGRGLNCVSGAQVQVARTLFDHNRDVGVFAGGESTSLTLTDAVVQDTQSRESDLTFGRGLECSYGAQVKAERSLFLHNRQIGVFASGAETSLTLADSVVQDTQSRENDKTFGRGLGCQDGAQVKVERSLFDHNRDIGVLAYEAGTSLTLTDSVVQDTQSQESDETFGRGLQCQYGAQVKVERSLFDHNRDAGVVAAQAGTSLTLTDSVVQDTQSQESNGEYGVGLAASSGAFLSLVRSIARNNRVAGLLVDFKSQASLSSVWFVDTQQGNFTPADDAGNFLPPIRGVGDGLVVLGGSSVEATDLLISGMSRAGLLFVDSTGSLATTRSTKSKYGMVLRGSSQPTYDETCSFDGNETPILPDGDLPVPNAPLKTPPPLD